MAVAPDGSPVDLYLRLPPRGEAEIVHGAIALGADVLELGCGVGRITHELVRLGHRVVAVDESAEMLAHVRGAETVQARIEELELGRRFPCVLFASNLVNADDDSQRRAFLRACARHVASDGVVLIERLPPDWQPDEEADGQLGDVQISARDVVLDERRTLATMHYAADGLTWTHPFSARLLDDDELDAELERAGLRHAAILDERGLWVAARRTRYAPSIVAA
jgi:SAM-dependent methyltransferase